MRDRHHAKFTEKGWRPQGKKKSWKCKVWLCSKIILFNFLSVCLLVYSTFLNSFILCVLTVGYMAQNIFTDCLASKIILLDWDLLHYGNYIILIFLVEDFSLLKGLDLMPKILWWLGFLYPSMSWSIYKGHTSYVLNTLTREIPCVLYSSSS